MSFIALNLSVEDVEYDAEEHTRELQIEQAFSSFQTALKLQKEFKFDEANKEYKHLFKIEVVGDTTKPFNSPNIRMLRYLSHRNRGLLHLEELRAGISSLSLEASLELFLNTIDDLIISLQYTDEDFTVETLLLSLFELVENDRLSRYVIEYELSNEQNQEVNLHERNRLNSPDYLSFFKKRQELLKRVGEPSHIDNRTQHFDLPKQDLSFLNPVLEYLKVRHEKFIQDESKVVRLESVTWRSLAIALNDLVPRAKFKHTRNEDLYSNSETPITFLSFEVPERTSNDQQIGKLEVIEDEAIQLNEGTDDDKKRKQEDIPHRSSKRVKEQSDFETGDSSRNKFLEEFNLFLATIGLKMDFDLNSTYSKADDLCFFDFHNSLNQWSNKHSDALFPEQRYKSDSANSNIALAELFNSNSFVDHLDPNTSVEYLGDTSAVDFIKKYSACHYVKVRNELISKLLSTEDGGICPITDLLFENDLFCNLEALVLSAEDILFNQLSSSGFQNYSVSVFELLLNRWISKQQQLKLRGIPSKILSDLNSYVNMIKPIILKWKKYLSQNIPNMNEKLNFRFKWATLMYIQHSKTSGIDKIKDLFNQLYEKLNSNDSQFNIGFVNYKCIPALNLSTIKAQSDKFNVITSFEKTFYSENHEATVKLLQRLLFSDGTFNDYSEEEQSMIQFINDGSVNFKLKLWRVLLGHYFMASNVVDFQKSLNIVLSILLNQLKPEQYNGQLEQHRQQILITTIAYYSEYIEEFVMLIKNKEWKVDEADASEILQNLIAIFRILYVYIIFEKSLKTATVKNRSFLKFRDTIVATICAILPLYGLLSKEEKYLRFFNVFHEEVGELNFCDASQGKLLDLSQYLLDGVDDKVFEAEILQHMNCKFHLNISSDTFVPFDHGTKKQVFDKNCAFQFSPYILKTIINKNYFFQSSFKQDLKHGLDMIYETFGDPDINDPFFQRNEARVDFHLNRPFDLRIFRDALSGELNDEYRKVSGPERVVYDDGLYYLEGVLNLNLYKSRKKAGQSKNSDLEYIVKMFRTDLICGSNRVESWFCLGQSYGFQAEDDLTWTSDKLNTIEKKLVTGTLQKKAILCYLMCVSLIINDSSKLQDNIKASVFGSFGRELYHSLARPMDGFAFLTSGERKILDPENGIIENSYEVTDEKRSVILKIISKTLKIAISFDGDDWMNYFYFTKVIHKMGRSVKFLLENSLKCCDKNPQGIEPHYQLASLVYKYFKAERIDIRTGLEFLKRAPCFNELQVIDHTDNELINFIISALKKLISLDKRKWHHQPRTKISKIYYDLKEYKKSFQEIESIIILKSTTKNLVNIWKPEFEAPGKHFVYTTIYIDFYIKLAEKMADLQGLILFNRKLRRFGACMIDLPSAWDISCTAICNLMKEIIRAEKNYTDIEVPKLVYSEFMTKSEKINDSFKNRDLKPDEISILALLYEISEIRRMNNGFGSTSLTDDTFNAIYLKIYLDLVNTLQDAKTDLPVTTVVNSTPTTPVKSKVARRDILGVASSLCKTIEQKIKNLRISDEIGFNVPQDIIDFHSNPEKFKIEQMESQKEESVSKELMKDETISNEPEAESITNVAVSETNLLKTPERNPVRKSSIDGSSDQDEIFHTPSESTNIC